MLVEFITLAELMQLQVLSTRFYAEVMPSLECKIRLPYPVWHGLSPTSHYKTVAKNHSWKAGELGSVLLV